MTLLPTAEAEADAEASRQMHCVTIQKNVRGWLARRSYQAEVAAKREKEQFLDKLAKYTRRLQARDAERFETLRMDGKEFLRYQASREAAATTLQAHWRGHTARRAYRGAVLSQQSEAAATIQKGFRSHLLRKSQDAAQPSTSSPQGQHRSPSRENSDHQAAGDLRASGSPSVRSSRDQRSPGDVRASYDSRAGSPSPPASPSAAAATSFNDYGVHVAPERARVLEAQARAKAERYAQRSDAPPPDLHALKAHVDAVMTQHRLRAGEARRALAAARDSRKRAAFIHQQWLAKHTIPSELPADAQPSDFARPPSDTRRMEAALQAHAMAKVEVTDADDLENADARWWKPLATLNKMTLADARAALARHDQCDRLRCRNWEMLLHTERVRPWPLGVPLPDEAELTRSRESLHMLGTHSSDLTGSFAALTAALSL